MSVDSLKDQLRKHKLLGKTSFTMPPTRSLCVLQLQTLLLEMDPEASDLPEGESGIEGHRVKRKSSSKAKGKASSGPKAKRKRSSDVREYMGYEWTAEEEDSFQVEAIVGMLVADGKASYANQGKPRKGTVLYRVVWKDVDGLCFPPDMIWYEPEDNLGSELPALVEYKAHVAAEAQEAAAERAEEAELAAMEEEEAMPAP